MFTEIAIFLLTFGLVYCLLMYMKIHRYFRRKGIKYVAGVPIFGNAYKSLMRKGHMIEDIDAVYKAFPDDKYVGYIEGTVPIILIRDPEIIKQVTVKDFDHFINRKAFVSEADSLLGGSLFSLKDEKWCNMRATLSPAFTSSKIKQMMPFMVQISNNIIDYLKECIKKESDIINVDDLMRRYTNDVIASAIFGFEVNSLIDKENQFYTIGQSLFNFSIRQRISFFCASQFPALAKKLKLQFQPRETITFFQKIVSNTIDYRRKNNVERPDMIQLLMETSKDWTQSEIIGQAFVFFFAGFENVASSLVMCIHELALNPHVQDKLYEEIKLFKETNSELHFNNVNDLKYLNCVLNETTRKWAAAVILDRTCSKSYELPPPRAETEPYKLKPGDIIYNVVNSIHMDPKYFPEPHVFNPERFSEDDKENINPFTFLPFGVGPRNCIGSRFALLELKVLLYYFILNFKIQKCEKTADPICLSPGMAIRSKDGTWVRLESRY